MWKYKITTGEVLLDGVAIATGYSGHGAGLNDPDYCAIHDVGPIPPGLYKLGAPYDSNKTGPFTISLLPVDHDAMRRDGFKIHGDNSKGDKSASHGCIIIPRHVREEIAKTSGTLEVIE